MSVRCCITGCAGFIGSHLAEACIKKGWKVYGIDNLSTGRKENIPKKVKFINTNINNINIENHKLPQFDYIFHLAGLADIVPSIENPEKYFYTNVNGTFEMIEFARKQKKLKKFMYAASASCYGANGHTLVDPKYPYALTKYLGEQILGHWGKVYKIPCTSLRLFNVFGRGQRTNGAYGAVFGTFLKQKLEGKPLTIVGDGEQKRDFIHVKDVVDAFITGAMSKESHVAYDIGTGNAKSINFIAELLGGSVIHIPKRPGEPEITEARVLPKWFKPKMSFIREVISMVENIEDYKDAPLWDEKSIKKATKNWFKYLS